LQRIVKCSLSLKVAYEWDLRLLLTEKVSEVVIVADFEEVLEQLDLLLVLANH
jgi:hypothetical protein